MMRAASAIVLAICSMWLFSQPAFADRRIALVMGNSAYHSVPSLANPANDASAMAKMFEGAGFDTVQLRLDLKAGDMRRALRDFSDDARDADVAIIYFAGHGIEIQGNNYIVPVDAVLERDIDAFDEAIPLDRLLTVIEPARKLRLIILDACRDNPFSKTMKRVTASRAVGRGLAKIEPDGPNTLIAFAAKAGSTADDGDTKHSPFTAALVKYLPTPGLDLRKAFGFVRDEVMRQTRNRQEPFIYGSLGGEDVALVPALLDGVPFVAVDDELGRHAEGLQRVPELVGLRRRHLGVALPLQYQGRRAHRLDEADGRAAGVDPGIVVHRGAKIRDHPLVDAVLTVVALPVDDAGAGHRGAEAPRLGDRPHRHVAAVAPAHDRQAILVDRKLLLDFVDP